MFLKAFILIKAKRLPDLFSETDASVDSYKAAKIFPQNVENIYKSIIDLEGVSRAAKVSGDYNVAVWAEAEDPKDINDILIKEIRGIEGVKEISTNVVIGETYGA